MILYNILHDIYHVFDPFLYFNLFIFELLQQVLMCLGMSCFNLINKHSHRWDNSHLRCHDRWWCVQHFNCKSLRHKICSDSFQSERKAWACPCFGDNGYTNPWARKFTNAIHKYAQNPNKTFWYTENMPTYVKELEKRKNSHYQWYCFFILNKKTTLICI